MSDDPDEILDVREIDGPPLFDILNALAALDEGETLLLINDFEPIPLYDVLDERGFEHATEEVADAEWHVEITNP